MVSTSGLAARLEARLQGGYRYAKFGRESGFLQSNQEVIAGLPSIHSYDSISSRAYGRLTRALSDRGSVKLGRHFTRLDNPGRISGPAMSYAGVGAILSHRPLDLPGWEDQEFSDGSFLLVPSETPSLVSQISEFEQIGGEVRLSGRLGEHSKPGWAHVAQRRDNYWAIETRGVNTQSLLFISTQYHEKWIARKQGEALRTIRINEFYLGVLLPPETTDVELAFEPLSRFAWVPLFLFAVSLASIAAAGRWRRSTTERSRSLVGQRVDP